MLLSGLKGLVPSDSCPAFPLLLWPYLLRLPHHVLTLSAQQTGLLFAPKHSACSLLWAFVFDVLCLEDSFPNTLMITPLLLREMVTYWKLQSLPPPHTSNTPSPHSLLQFFIVLVYLLVSPLSKFHVCRHFCLFYSLLYLWCLKQCLKT